MAYLDYRHGSFTTPSEHGYISVHAEMAPAAKGISPTGRYFIYCLHSTFGTCHFIAEQNEDYDWIAQLYPVFIDQEFISWVGKKIEASVK